MEICGFKQNNYIQKDGKKIRKKWLIESCAMMFAVMNIMGVTMVVDYACNDVIGKTTKSVVMPYLPSDDAIKTNAMLNELKLTKDLKFALPMHTKNIKVLDKQIDLIVDSSIMVKCMEDGVVEKIDQINGLRNITIRHSKDITSMINNIDACGVSVGQKVAQGCDIGTAKLNGIITIKIYKNGEPQKLSLDKNFIKWEL